MFEKLLEMIWDHPDNAEEEHDSHDSSPTWDETFIDNPVYRMYQANGVLSRSDLLRAACQCHSWTIVGVARSHQRFRACFHQVLGEQWELGVKFPHDISCLCLQSFWKPQWGLQRKMQEHVRTLGYLPFSLLLGTMAHVMYCSVLLSCRPFLGAIQRLFRLW